MLLVSKLKEEKRLEMNEQEEKLFGIEKLNIPRSSVPAITHVDYSARLQTVHNDTNKIYHSLLSKFMKKLSVPFLLIPHSIFVSQFV